MTKLNPHGISARMAQLRADRFGARGKSRFARELGIGSSTYDRYERDRVPPAHLLLKAARLTGTRIEWLISGEGPQEESGSSLPADLTWQLQSLLARGPEYRQRVEDFLAELAAESGK